MNMRSLTSRILSPIIVSLSGPAWTEEATELLLPVETGIQNRLLAKSNYGFRSQLYFAKRFRLSRIDFSLLNEPGAEFTITPFDDVQIAVKTTSVSGRSSVGQLREWSGEVLAPIADAPAFDEQGNSVQLPQSIIKLWVRSGPHEVPIKLVEDMNARGEREFGILSDVEGPLDQEPGKRVCAKLPLTTVSGEFYLIARGKRFVIQPIEDDPRYHVIYEADPEKTPESSHTPNEEMTRKLRARNEFVEALERERAEAIKNSELDSR